MKVKTDENLPEEAAHTLNEQGFDAESVWAEHLSSADDEIIAARVRDEQRILITPDLDFANIQRYPPGDYTGIIVLRLKVQDKATVLECIRRLAVALGQRNPQGELWIVEADRIRFRTQPQI